MLDMVMSAVNYKSLISSEIKEPRKRFVQYYKDLYAHLGGEIDESIFKEGSQFNYSELGESVLTDCHRLGELDCIDLMVFSYWSHEFDPDHASCGAYLSHKFNLDCKLFDVCEQGTLSPFTSIKIIYSFLKNSKIKKALLLILEQTTIPRNKEDFDVVPTETGAVSIILEKSSKGPYRIKLAEIILDIPMLKSSLDLIEKFLELYHSNIKNNCKTNLYLRKNSYLWKIFIHFKNELPENFNIISFSSQNGCLQPWAILQKAFKENSTKFNIFLIDQDAESLSTGVLLLEPMNDV